MKPIEWIFALAIACAPAGAQDILWNPAGFGAQEGNANNFAPFGARSATYQQLLDDEHVRATLGSRRTLSGIAFRKEAAQPAELSARTLDVQIVVGATPLDSTNISNTFAANLGSNPQVVLPWTTINLPRQDNVSNPNPPGWIVPWTMPYEFVSTPGMGLCWEWRHRDSTVVRGVNSVLDAHFTTGGSLAFEGSGCRVPGQSRPARMASVVVWYGTSTMDASLLFATPNAPALFVLGNERANLQLPGMCAPLLTQPVFTAAATTDPLGNLQVSFGGLDLRGIGSVSLFSQFLWSDPGLGLGVGLSDLAKSELHPLSERGWARAYDAPPGGTGTGHLSTTATIVGVGVALVTGFVAK